jgi:para-nitrobenzyl esterase
MHPVVRTRQGEVRGRASGGVSAFKGIPYAAPPFGANRLLPPQPAVPWGGVRDALVFGPKAPQPPYPPAIEMMLPELVGSGEDCLTLNIWSPDPGASRLPVMFWIPGGMFEYHGTGASPWYDGSRFARDGVVCVTINYRVGAEGFLYLSDGTANLGLLDQVAALEWLRENIAAFGGDPGNVTIFGESAGAMCVATLLAMPSAEGLFRRAIAQSGAAQSAISPATARRVAGDLARRLGVVAIREAIAGVPVERLLAAQAALREDLVAQPDPERWGPEVASSMMPWQPVIDGEVLPAPPLERIAAGAAADVDVLVGTNLDEHRLFLAPVGALEGATAELLASTVAAYGLPFDAALAVYREAYAEAGVGDLLAAVLTDGYWRIPAIRLADAHVSGNAATWMYEFAWRSPQFGGRLGACHVLEVPFVFDTLGQGTEPLWGTEPPQALADTMHATWVAFATSGDPGWPKYDLGRRATMRFGVPSQVTDDPRAAERALWASARKPPGSP